MLCGIAWSMPALIAFRALQGLGAGAVQPMAMTIIGDIYSVAERAKVQGYLASVWAISAVIGPTPGRVLRPTTCPGAGSSSSTSRWRTRGLVCCSEDSTSRSIRATTASTIAGAVLLGVGASLLILGLLEGGIAVGLVLGPPASRFSPSARCS